MWSDCETEYDFLGYASYVNVLADICTHQELAPLTLGIFGSWGSGKTSLMRMLKAKLDGDAAARNSATKTLWFNAWRYEGREEAQSALIHAVLAKLAEDQTLVQDAKETFERLKKGASVLKLAKFIGKSVMTMTPDIGGFIDCFKEESEKIAETMEGFDKDFESLLKQAKIDRIVVFIDDLDRCSSAKVIETFETIKLFLNTPACTFVIGADADKIEHAVGEVFKVDDEKRRKDYLEKIVQIPFTIPEQDLTDIACYVGLLVIGRHIPAESWTKLCDARPAFYEAGEGVEKAFYQWPNNNRALFPAPDLDAVLNDLKGIMPHADSLGRGLRGNPRQIKRFLNILGLRRRLAEENKLNTDPALLVKFTVLEYVWPRFFNAVIDTVDPSSGHSELIVEVIRAGNGNSAPESPMVAEAVAQAGLLNYLSLPPMLDASVDLKPYLFLANTALNRARSAGLLPLEEQARKAVEDIQSDDQLRSKMAAKRAASLDATAASAVVRQLLTTLATAKATAPRTHLVTGLSEICQKHPIHFPAAVKALESVGPDQPGTPLAPAIAIAADALLKQAKRAGATVPTELTERFQNSSPIAGALAAGKQGTKPSSRS